MNWFVFHIAGGDAFLSGVAFCFVGSLLSVIKKAWIKQVATLLFLVGLIAVAVSSTPLSYWYYGVLGLAAIVWLFVVRSKDVPQRKLWMNAAAMTAILAVGLALEVPWRMTPAVEVSDADPVFIYGDSLSAGLGEGDITTWPELLKRNTHANTRNFAKVGSTVARTLKLVESQNVPAGIVIVEIGGNDVLGQTTAADFERDLNRLLELLVQRHNQVIMFELPLPPFYNAFGRAQRTAAKRNGVQLIPKRVVMGILAADGATLDSIHLSKSGHERLAETMGSILKRQNAN